jgi:uncharacterized protein (UPF0264 family)
MSKYLVARTDGDVQAIREKGDHTDSRKAAWFAITKGSEVIEEIQRHGRRRRWKTLDEALPFANPQARAILDMRLEAIHSFKIAPHHRRGFRMNARTGARSPRPVNALCLISGHEGQEIPGFVDPERVVVDVEHMEQALGPASLTEIFNIRKRIGENVYISTNVSETPQIVRAVETGAADARSTAALTTSKVVAALNAGADVVKVGFANVDPYKRDLKEASVLEQMRLVRSMVDAVVRESLLVYPLGRTGGRYPLISVFFPEMGINSAGERPMEIAEKGIDLTRRAGWQGILIDTFEKYTGKRYVDFYTVPDTARLAKRAHESGLEFWIAGSIRREEVRKYLECQVDLICFGGAARHETGLRVETRQGQRDESIKRGLVEKLVAEFDRVDPKPKAERRRPR